MCVCDDDDDDDAVTAPPPPPFARYIRLYFKCSDDDDDDAAEEARVMRPIDLAPAFSPRLHYTPCFISRHKRRMLESWGLY